VAPKSIFEKAGALDINGQVEGSVLPDMVGLEAGQAAFGDTFAWYAELLAWGRPELDKDFFFNRISEAAAKEPVDIDAPIFMDWLNGRRSPKANLALKGAFTGLTLSTTAPRLYRSLAEGLAFGFRRIVETIADHGVEIKRVIATGSVAKRSPFVMQITADVLGIPIQVAASEQTCALGAAMIASVAAGLHKSVRDAQDAMGQGNEREYIPNRHSSEQYRAIYEKYLSIAERIESVDR
jgi:L-ribulokinase